MNSIIVGKYNTAIVALTALLVIGSVFVAVPTAYAQYDDFSTGGGLYDDFATGGGFYDDFSTGGGYYDNVAVGGSYYDDVPRTGTWYDDVPRTGTYYDDVPRSGTYYDDVARTASTPAGTVYNPSTGVYETVRTAASNGSFYVPTAYESGASYGSAYNRPTYSNPSSFYAAAAYSLPSYQQPRYEQPRPQYTQQQPTYQQSHYQQPSYQQPSYSNVNNTSNYCTNGSCNYADSSFVDNSINHSFNNPATVTTIYPVTAQPIVQYQIPQITYPLYNYTTPTYPVYNQNVYCTITASPTYIQNGQASYLSWTSNGSSAFLSDGIGAVTAQGTLAVRPDTNRTYTLTVYGQGGSNTCSVTISVSGQAPYVSLNQIPYTGFDLGPIGNTLYWFALAGIAMAAAYFALNLKNGVMAFAGSMSSARVNHAAAPVIAHVAPVTHTPAAPARVNHQEMQDTMFITRGKDGTPRIVINRA